MGGRDAGRRGAMGGDAGGGRGAMVGSAGAGGIDGSVADRCQGGKGHGELVAGVPCAAQMPVTGEPVAALMLVVGEPLDEGI